MTHAPRTLLAFSLALMACTEGTPSLSPPPDDAGRPALPRKDASADVRVAACDQAADGTPCGDTDGWHCVYGVCAANLCGDGVVAGDEWCDDGNDRDGDGCPADCMESTVCRDGNVDPGEECDDGNRENADACSNSCLANECGNGRLDYGEECDDGNKRTGDGCDDTCGVVACGNMRLELGETCDGAVGCPTGQTCNDTCSECQGDPCAQCEKEKCSDYEGVDLYAGCYLTEPENAIAGFIEICAALNACVRADPFCADPDNTQFCFCGNQTAEECAAAVEVNGPCTDLYLSAVPSCQSEERVNNCVLDRFIDFSVPTGWVNFLGQCRNDRCRMECGYEPQSSVAGTP